MRNLQKKVGIFVDRRKWGNAYQIYGMMLNIIEEVGEAWNIVKHLEKEETLLKKVIKDNKSEFEDFIGDLYFLTLKIAHVVGVDAQKALEDRLKEFEHRFPEDFMRKHSFAGNRRAGGVDNKYSKKK